jgi:hypothetical protein
MRPRPGERAENVRRLIVTHRVTNDRARRHGPRFAVVAHGRRARHSSVGSGHAAAPGDNPPKQRQSVAKKSERNLKRDGTLYVLVVNTSAARAALA